MVWWCPGLHPSVSHSFPHIFSYMLWHIELKFCILLYFDLLQIKHFASVIEGVMPLFELRIYGGQFSGIFQTIRLLKYVNREVLNVDCHNSPYLYFLSGCYCITSEFSFRCVIVLPVSFPFSVLLYYQWVFLSGCYCITSEFCCGERVNYICFFSGRYCITSEFSFQCVIVLPVSFPFSALLYYQRVFLSVRYCITSEFSFQCVIVLPASFPFSALLYYQWVFLSVRYCITSEFSFQGLIVLPASFAVGREAVQTCVTGRTQTGILKK